MSKLKAEVVPYSNIVGGGVVLMDETGAVIGQLGLMNFGVDIVNNTEFKTEYMAMCERIARAINVGQSERAIRHLKTGGEYDVLGPALFQVSNPAEGLFGIEKGRIVEDGDEVTLYARRTEGEPRLFIRFPDEIDDTNRFQDITTLA